MNAAIAVVVAAGVAAAAGHYLQAGEAEATVVAPPNRTVDPAVPEARLLNSVLYIDGWREFGNPVGFTYVPKTRPPGLVDLNPGNPPNLSGGSHRGSGNGAQIDAYHLKGLFVALEFAATPTETCANAQDPPRAICVRDNKPTVPDPADINLRYTTAYFTAGKPTTFKSKTTEAAKRFWSKVEMVPVQEAPWFTDLVTRAEASLQK
ncbi:hypothetical protein OWR29_33525 [Actinoplanes sp. Pm04-4]|uniref:Uncharacterized protein n=1 Tax=Paractinoplanes pyxinae TaxID=2997416 RepID=A0ABT4B8W0_9ACTN|nr:hypothetical protein [Actinoplanes pyxinae]MCY1142941.1 hypothetical protein [Actinoplanes pyxinae]